MRPVPELLAIFQGDLSHFATRFVLPGSPEPALPGSALAHGPALARLVKAHARLYPGADMRAVTSLWSTAHFEAFLVPMLVLALLAGRAIDPELSALGFTFTHDGATRFIHLRDAGRPAAVDDIDLLFEHFVEGHLRPLVLALSGVTGTSPRVLFANAGNLAEAVVSRIETERGLGPLLARARRVLDHSGLPTGRPNPLTGAVRYRVVDGVRLRRRRLCCIRFLAPGLGFCQSCPCHDRPA